MASEARDAVVIGAGLAGLAAARRLESAGRTTVILEARDRIGGRVHTLHEPGWPAPIEAGAEFVHGHSPAMWDAIRAAGIGTDNVRERHWRCADTRAEQFDFDQVWRPVYDRLKDLPAGDLSFTEFLRTRCPNLSSADRELVLGYAEGFNAADAERLSTRWVKESEAAVGEESGPPVRPHGGYDRLASWYHKQLNPRLTDLRLNTPVTAVRWRRGEVDVIAGPNGQQFAAKAVIVTLPLGVLQAPGSVRFDPEPPGKREAWNTLPMGAVVKLVVNFREPFWADAASADLGFLHTPAGPLQVWWSNVRAAPTVLTGWAGGPAAKEIAGLDPRALLDRALAQLAGCFPIARDRLASLVAAWRAFDWQADPWARGAYSYVPVGGLDVVRRFAEPVAGTLFFAGEATDGRFAGTVAGAIASGERAADEALVSF